MAAARYTVHVPAEDEHGNPLRLHEAVHQHLNRLGGHASFQEGWPTHSVTAWAEDMPEWDSTAKQTGAYAGELANVPSVMVTKEGKTPAMWHIANPLYRPGEPAEQPALANEPNINTILMQNPEDEYHGGHPLTEGNPLGPSLAATQIFL